MINSQAWTTAARLCDARQLTGRSAMLPRRMASGLSPAPNS